MARWAAPCTRCSVVVVYRMLTEDELQIGAPTLKSYLQRVAHPDRQAVGSKQRLIEAQGRIYCHQSEQHTGSGNHSKLTPPNPTRAICMHFV